MLIPEPDELEALLEARKPAGAYGLVRAGRITRDDCYFFGELLGLLLARWPSEVPVEALVCEMLGVDYRPNTPTVPRARIAVDRGMVRCDQVKIARGAMQVRHIGSIQMRPYTAGMRVGADLSALRWRVGTKLFDVQDQLMTMISALEEAHWEPATDEDGGLEPAVRQLKFVDRDGKSTGAHVNIPVIFHPPATFAAGIYRPGFEPVEPAATVR